MGTNTIVRMTDCVSIAMQTEMTNRVFPSSSDSCVLPATVGVGRCWWGVHAQASGEVEQ